MKTLIVGGVAGGASTAARLRRLDEEMEIILFERGEYISYANCGLPYYIGDEITEKESLTLQTPESFHERFHVDIRILQEVISIQKEEKTITIRNMKTKETYNESYDYLVLSPGAKAFIPPIKGIDQDHIFSLRTIPDTYRIKEFIHLQKPKSALIVGGGFIGLEMAENLHHAGLKVHVVEAAPYIATVLDEEMASDVTHYMRSKGIIVETNTKIDDFTSVKEDLIIISVGVRPENELALQAGLEVSKQGSIIINEHMKTSDANIYAIGDAVQVKHFVSGQDVSIPLAGPANKQGRIVADNICNIPSTYSGTQGSSILKLFDMSVGATGLNEWAIKQLQIPYDKVFLFPPSHATYYPGAQNMSLKVLFGKESGNILGAQIVGFEGVDKRIDVIAIAIRAHMNMFQLTELELAYAPPFSSAKDPINMAGFSAENILTGRIKQFHWDEVDALATRTDITMLDVRLKEEYEEGHISNTIHIPLNELRDRFHELDASKPIYVNCQSGLRSYIAVSLLSQKGFDTFNLAEGYRLYASTKQLHEYKNDVVHGCGIKVY